MNGCSMTRGFKMSVKGCSVIGGMEIRVNGCSVIVMTRM